MSHALKPFDHPAHVMRSPVGPRDGDQYLVMNDAGIPAWTRDLREATAFASMKEAVRVALRLPGEFRAFGLPAPAEVAVAHTLH